MRKSYYSSSRSGSLASLSSPKTHMWRIFELVTHKWSCVNERVNGWSVNQLAHQEPAKGQGSRRPMK